ncbi:hypothetical protein R3P38DRAFT_2636261, partial [Favolaschia claudopus]
MDLGALQTVAGETAFLRAVIAAQPVGRHKHFHLLQIRESIRRETGHLVSVEEVLRKSESLWNIEELDRRYADEELHANASLDGSYDYVLPFDIQDIVRQRYTDTEGETRVIRITAHRWFSIGLEFQVEFADDDILW